MSSFGPNFRNERNINVTLNIFGSANNPNTQSALQQCQCVNSVTMADMLTGMIFKVLGIGMSLLGSCAGCMG